MEHEIEQTEEIALIFTQVFEPEEVATLINYMGMGRSYAYIAYQHLCMIQRSLSKGDQREAEEIADDLMKTVAECFMAHGIIGSSNGDQHVLDVEYDQDEEGVATIELSMWDVILYVMVAISAVLVLVGFLK